METPLWIISLAHHVGIQQTRFTSIAKFNYPYMEGDPIFFLKEMLHVDSKEKQEFKHKNILNIEM